jgi:hypothetical protein
MNYFQTGDFASVKEEFIETFPSLKGVVGRVYGVSDELVHIMFKNSSGKQQYHFHYKKLNNPRLIRLRKIETILND